jgi:CTP:molybdopterin cytidylyltransferase MocA
VATDAVSAAASIVGIVLAAGDGVRMGGSKALLLVKGEPLVVAHARRLREAGCARVVVVVRPEVAVRLGVAPVEGLRVVVSSAGDQAGSLAVAVREGGVGRDEVVVITPVDAAPVAKGTIAALLAELGIGHGHGHGDREAVTAGCGGKGGHPVVCWGRVLEAFRQADPPPLRDVIRALGEKRVRVETEDPSVLVDLDTPEDVMAWTGRAPVFEGG